MDIYVALKDKYRVLKYSGDTDGAIPTYGTKQWINELNWPIKTQWHPFKQDGQVAGYSETRNNGKFTFATIHGGGHMAPQWKRPQTYRVVFNFLRGDPI
jgi:carboxypeptidase C (cathepsin A)